ncbi:hypothetical protein [Bifidobacterium saguinibicoloris]|uniref:hypothetical protein n=1 Tax=Bifidobacterium saguinibicoloris TaxID=2834433 RepID=UPI001C598A93|nr:hypothetical protein [Bifidobacterium saguinibicoloris]MBW3080149.1 hypothetical protein [Bifidobacterium saguinibicoloris]
MAKQLNEQQVLKKLGIPDFRHMTKEKAITLVSMLDRVDPRVAMEALKQFPALAGMLVDEAKEYREIIFRAFDSNDQSNKAAMDTINKVIDVLSGRLDKDDLTDEERLRLTQQIVDLAKMAADKDSENKQFHIRLAATVTAAFVALAGVAVVALGGNAKITGSNDDPELEA